MNSEMIWSWFTSLASCLAIVFMGRKYWWAPIYGALQELVWIGFVIATETWPLFVCVAGYTIVYVCTIPKWYRERNHG